MRPTEERYRKATENKPEIRWVTHPNGCTVACYMIAGKETWDDDWLGHVRECRGITFYNGEIVGRPLHKFFNVGERPETMREAIDWTKVTRVMSKIDGSLIHTVAIPEDDHIFTVKSKKSFVSDVAIAAKAFIRARPNYLGFCEELTKRGSEGYTAIFEYTSPASRIVLDYPEALTLLHIRANNGGRYWPYDQLKQFAEAWRVPLVDSFGNDICDDLLDTVEASEGIEGYVVQFENGDMVKLKTRWYLDRHYHMTELRRRDVARAVLNETLDDIKATFAQTGMDPAPLLAVEHEVLEDIRTLEQRVEALYEANRDLDRKTVAIANKEHELFSLLMRRYSGQEPDYKKHYERYVLEDKWDLRLVIDNPAHTAQPTGD